MCRTTTVVVRCCRCVSTDNGEGAKAEAVHAWSSRSDDDTMQQCATEETVIMRRVELSKLTDSATRHGTVDKQNDGMEPCCCLGSPQTQTPLFSMNLSAPISYHERSTEQGMGEIFVRAREGLQHLVAGSSIMTCVRTK